MIKKDTPPRISYFTLGCRVNQYESRAIQEFLEAEGMLTVPFESECDACVINTCAVTAESERKSRQIIRRAAKNHPNAAIIVTGCQSQLHPNGTENIPGVKYIGGNSSKLNAAKAVSAYIKGLINAPFTDVCEISDVYEEYSVKKPDHTRAYIKIEDGCENRCAYCIIPKVRGPVRSKSPENVICEVKGIAEGGCKEIVLTGIETCSYQYGLAELIDRLSDIDGIERIRLSSANPSFINKKFADRIKNNPKFCPHFHLSLQSFCDKTLNAMRRRYNSAMIKENCTYLRECIPNICFTADMICGFPGETDEDFAVTVENTEKLGLLFAHIFPYSDRPGTEASSMTGKVEEKIKNERCAVLRDTVKKSQNILLSRFIDEKTPLSLLLETEKDGYLYGHTENFIEARIPKSVGLVGGQIVPVVLTEKNNRYGEYMANATIFDK